MVFIVKCCRPKVDQSNIRVLHHSNVLLLSPQEMVEERERGREGKGERGEGEREYMDCD